MGGGWEGSKCEQLLQKNLYFTLCLHPSLDKYKLPRKTHPSVKLLCKGWMLPRGTGTSRAEPRLHFPLLRQEDIVPLQQQYTERKRNNNVPSEAQSFIIYPDSFVFISCNNRIWKITAKFVQYIKTTGGFFTFEMLRETLFSFKIFTASQPLSSWGNEFHRLTVF